MSRESYLQDMPTASTDFKTNECGETGVDSCNYGEESHSPSG